MGKLTAKGIEGELRKPRAKRRKLWDGDGLYLEIPASGNGRWRVKYRFEKKEKLLSLGVFPDVSLREARDKTYEARKLLRDGVDPAAAKKLLRRASAEQATFEMVAREWFGVRSPEWSERRAQNVMSRLELKVFPYIGSRPVEEVSSSELLDVLRRIEAEGKIHTAHTVYSICGRIFRYAVATDRAKTDPSAALKGTLKKEKVVHRPGIIDPKAFGELLRAIDGYKGDYATTLALKALPLLFVRPGELRNAEWDEVDLEKATWTISAAKMKMSRDHIVPLSRQALALFEDARRMKRASKYVFPSSMAKDRPMSDNTLNSALRRLGYSKEQVTAHGFRASARTMLDEQLRKRPDLIEHQLAHSVKGPLGRAYNRAEFLDERREMMQEWADYLDGLKAG